MTACRAEWPRLVDARALARARYPTDRRLADLPAQVEGFATENKLMLLNLAVRYMDPGEVYVEVGSWRGLSAAGALAGNPDKRAFLCDDFSRFGGSREKLEANLEARTRPGQVSITSSDYRPFLVDAPWRPARVGVFFYDGAHHFHHQFHALELIRPSLADNAVIIIDDTNDRPVRAANRLFERRVPGFEPALDIRVARYMDPTWWNGIQVFRWRPDSRPARLPLSAAELRMRRLIWSRFVVYGQRAYSFAQRLVNRNGSL